MPKGWKCLNCKSYNLKKFWNKINPGKWMVQAICEDCTTVMRFTKHGSFIYAYPEKELEKIPF